VLRHLSKHLEDLQAPYTSDGLRRCGKEAACPTHVAAAPPSPHLHGLQQHVWRLRHAAVWQVVQEDRKADGRV
jgi:hypothetical protein